MYALSSNIINTNEWPNFWKCAYVTPFKKGSKSDVENYRPISILPRLSLVLEKIIFDYLYCVLRSKLSARQHGFRSGHSTITQLLVCLHDIYENFDSNSEQIIVYLDFSKAFDTVNHNILLCKLAYFGLDENFLKLMKTYLTNRTQRVQIDGCLSGCEPISSGVPQGSVLGPLLFLIYIDDMLALPSFSTCFCYADDTKLVCSSENIFFNLQQDLKRLSQWCRDNSMMFNLNKCVFLHLSEKTTGSLFIDDYQLQKVDSICGLGLQVSKTLKWDAHIRGKLPKARQNFNYLRHSVPYCIPSKVKFNLFSACVMLSLLYASPAWHVDATHLRLLEKFYWKGLCWCFGYSGYKYILSLSESLPIAYQLIDRDLKFFISIVQGKSCIPFSQYFSRARSNKCLRSGQTVHLVVNACAKKLTAKSYFNRIQTVVNDFNDVGDFDLLYPPLDYKNRLRKFFSDMRDCKFEFNRTCTWSIKCRCPISVS